MKSSGVGRTFAAALLFGAALIIFTAGAALAQDLDCADVGSEVSVAGSDPHGLDADNDGVGCEGWGGGSYEGSYNQTRYTPTTNSSSSDETNWWPWILGGGAVWAFVKLSEA